MVCRFALFYGGCSKIVPKFWPNAGRPLLADTPIIAASFLVARRLFQGETCSLSEPGNPDINQWKKEKLPVEGRKIPPETFAGNTPAGSLTEQPEATQTQNPARISDDLSGACCELQPGRGLLFLWGSVVPLHGLQDRAVDKGVHAFPAAFGVAFDHILLPLWHIYIDPVVILPNVFVDGLLLRF